MVKEIEPTEPSLVEKTFLSIAQSMSDIYWSVVGSVKSVAGGVASGISSLASVVTNSTMFIFNTTGNILASVGSVIGNTTQSIATATGDAVSFIAGKTSGAIGDALLASKNGVSNYSGTQWSRAVATKDSIIALALGTRNLVATATSPLINSLSNFYIKQKTKAVVVAELWFDQEATQIKEVKIVDVGEDYMTLTWTTNHHTTNNKVNYGETTSYGNQAFSQKLGKEHTVTLTELAPDTKYVFEVMSQGKNYAYDAHFEFVTKALSGDNQGQVQGITDELSTNSTQSISWLFVLVLLGVTVFGYRLSRKY